ncbi:hypothetical protein CONPUDRAFT_141133 [Coniophora puteana RWD-64-598 SS2]|uniref:BZIP domain-containing protein n=1 Tax=Coniophora puteana (strain RWD-64-598) TaxID=741705 RepID=A0A5M3N5X4_CONPW|nr:uncharacterized protein CONPUDRAFT_141133 [Coniophora puteana RWD-64-598 SS2]EIW86696.1 hypothetical protein CONPUDRAFT_141133 [Coniophora puteana RWD-64-598 SS2]
MPTISDTNWVSSSVKSEQTISHNPSARMSDAEVRKKKNASAQAAFRQRRQNYINSLEETVTGLEKVVLQIQESYRDARAEVVKLRQENSLLRQSNQDRDALLKKLWQERKLASLDELSSQPSLSGIRSNGLGDHVSSVQPNQLLGIKRPHYEIEDDAASVVIPFGSATGHAQSFTSHSSSASYSGSVDNHHAMMNGNLTGTSGQYACPIQNAGRDAVWHQNMSTVSANGSPVITSSDAYGQYNFSEQKLPSEAIPHIIQANRSLSPNSTPPSSSSASLTSPLHFAYAPDDLVRQHGGHPADLTLRGAVDLPMNEMGNSTLRYRMGIAGPTSGADAKPDISYSHRSSHSDRDSPLELASNEGEPSSSRTQYQQDIGESRSPSPAEPPISGTLAVIKAQAFGALRRTRSKTKKSADGGAKTALDLLAAKGIGMGVPTSSKRPRLFGDDLA